MKKILLTALAILTMSMVSFAGNGGPHTKEYREMKAMLDNYLEAIKKAQSCDDLDISQLDFIMAVLSFVDNEYEEDETMTEAEDKEIKEYMDQIDDRLAQLKAKWNCPTDGDEEEPELNLIPTSTKEWDELLDSYDAVTRKLSGMKTWDFSDETRMNMLLEVLNEAAPIVSRIDNADTEHLTDKQSKRLDDISEQFLQAARAIGLTDE